MKLFKFLAVGASGTLIGLGTLYLLSDMAGMHYLVANIFAFILAVTSNYTLNSLWTFRLKKGMNGWLRYAGISGITFFINEGILYLLTDKAGLWYMLSAVIATAIVSLVNFIMSQRYVWNRNIDKQTEQT